MEEESSSGFLGKGVSEERSIGSRERERAALASAWAFISIQGAWWAGEGGGRGKQLGQQVKRQSFSPAMMVK